MRNLIVAVAFIFCVGLPQASSAESAKPEQLREAGTGPSPRGQLPDLLRRLGSNLISKAQAAECTAEGETCTSNEQCCPGLECTGGPPATCTTED